MVLIIQTRGSLSSVRPSTLRKAPDGYPHAFFGSLRAGIPCRMAHGGVYSPELVLRLNGGSLVDSHYRGRHVQRERHSLQGSDAERCTPLAKDSKGTHKREICYTPSKTGFKNKLDDEHTTTHLPLPSKERDFSSAPIYGTPKRQSSHLLSARYFPSLRRMRERPRVRIVRGIVLAVAFYIELGYLSKSLSAPFRTTTNIMFRWRCEQRDSNVCEARQRSPAHPKQDGGGITCDRVRIARLSNGASSAAARTCRFVVKRGVPC